MSHVLDEDKVVAPFAWRHYCKFKLRFLKYLYYSSGRNMAKRDLSPQFAPMGAGILHMRLCIICSVNSVELNVGKSVIETERKASQVLRDHIK